MMLLYIYRNLFRFSEHASVKENDWSVTPALYGRGNDISTKKIYIRNRHVRNYKYHLLTFSIREFQTLKLSSVTLSSSLTIPLAWYQLLHLAEIRLPTPAARLLTSHNSQAISASPVAIPIIASHFYWRCIQICAMQFLRHRVTHVGCCLVLFPRYLINFAQDLNYKYKSDQFNFVSLQIKYLWLT